METQTVINLSIGAVGALLGVIMKAIWDAVKDLQNSDKAIVKDVAELQVLVAGNYITRGEFSKVQTALFEKLDRIDAKLDLKADKANCPTPVHQ